MISRSDPSQDLLVRQVKDALKNWAWSQNEWLILELADGRLLDELVEKLVRLVVAQLEFASKRPGIEF